MSNSSLGTPQQLRDPNYTPPLGQAIPLGIQHVLAMFASNVTPAIIVAGAAGFGFGSNSPDFGNMIYMIQMAMLFAGVATLIQTIGMGPIGARLPIVQGTSFAFLPIMIPAVLGAGVAGMAGLMTGVLVGGLFHMVLGLFIGRIRFALPPLVTGLIVLMIGLALVKVGIQYAAGGVPAMGALNKAMAAKADISGMEFGSLWNWSIALVVIIVTLAIKFFSKGFLSVAAILIGLVAGYVYAYVFGDAHFARAFGNVGNAAWFAAPSPFKFGFAWDWAIIIGMCLMAFISAIETVGDTSGITKGGAGREATDTEITGATYADGLGTAIAGIFGSLPNTSFSQNVGLISMTGIMSRGVVTIGAIFLIICGLIPKVGAVISTVPIEVLGGGVIVMFGMVAAAGINMLSDVNWNRRNMLIFATAISIGLGLQLVPNALAHMNGTWKILLTSGLLPAAFIAILLNLLLPEDESDDDHMTAMAGLDSTSDHSHGGAGAQAGAGARGVAHAVENAASHAGQSTSASALISGGGAAVAGGAAALASAGSSAKSAASGAGSSAASAAGSAAKTVKAKAKTAKKSASATVKKAAPKKAAAKAPAKKATAKAAPAKKAAAKKAPAAKKASSAKGKLAGSAIDDLEFVDGIGPKTAKSLQSAGVKNLSGLVKMSDANLEKAAQKAGTGGRPESENWKKQATDILGGKAPQAKSDRAAWERAMKKM